MSIRLFHRGARWVFVLVRREREIGEPGPGPASEHRWLSVHRKPHPWLEIFSRALQRLDLEPFSLPSIELGGGLQPPVSRSQHGLRDEEVRTALAVDPSPSGLRFGGGMGDFCWTDGRHWTTIDLQLASGSLRKRQLIAAALLKAARYQLE